MKRFFVIGSLLLAATPARAEYRRIRQTVFGMD